MNVLSINRNIESDAGMVAAQVAHDLRAPISALRVILNSLPGVQDYRGQLMVNAIERIESITKVLLDKQSFNGSQNRCLLEAVKTLLEEFNIHSSCRIFFQMHSNDKQVLMTQDLVTLIQRMFSILISNAIEASKFNSPISIMFIIEANECIFSVKDIGVGLSQDEIKKIGKRGYSKKVGGHGIGLNFIKQNLDKINGKLLISSVKNKGSHFQIRFKI